MGKWQGEGHARSNGAGGRDSNQAKGQFSAESRQKTHRWPNWWAGVRDGSVRVCMAESHAQSRVTIRTILSDRSTSQVQVPALCVWLSLLRVPRWKELFSTSVPCTTTLCCP